MCGDARVERLIPRRERTVHFCDPYELLAENARSEFRPEFREWQAGGGFKLKARSAG